jgi:hypothetical protein
LTTGAVAIQVRDPEALSAALLSLGLRIPLPVVAVVGGAGGLDGDTAARLERTFVDVLVPLIDAIGAAAVDGGTDSGVMRLLGSARAGGGYDFPLVGVAAEGTVVLPDAGPPRSDGGPPRSDAAPLDANHSHFVLVPGTEWGDESEWLARTATEIAGTARAASVTVLINGGAVALRDAESSIDAGRPLLVIDGTGRTADRIAAAARNAPDDARVARLAASPLVHVVPLHDGHDGRMIRNTLEAIMSGR